MTVAVKLSLEQRIERLEQVAVLLAFDASVGNGSMGKKYWDFIDVMNAERLARETESHSDQPIQAQ